MIIGITPPQGPVLPISKSDLGHVLRTEPFAWVWCPGMTDWAQAASDRFALVQSAIARAVRQRPQPDAEIGGVEVS